MKQLADAQLEPFDTEYVTDELWERMRPHVDRDFPDADFSFLDLGGGNGKFADRLLQSYPRATGTVLDNSELLLGRNTAHPRKTLVCASAERAGELRRRYDVVCVNWLLHHLVGDSYAESRSNIRSQLESVRQLLSERGRISVLENLYNGLVFEALPARLVYMLTSWKSVAPMTRSLGANTAGVGVCFLSRSQWHETFAAARLRVLAEREEAPWGVPLAWKAFLHIREIRVGHYWLAADHT